MTNELDKISLLPRNITDQILSLLPIKDAVRTSILSREWRYKWSTLPQLVFDDQCTDTAPPHENLVKIIDKVLLLHNGPIQKFKLSHRGFCATSDIDHWILHLSRVFVKAIILDNWDGHDYRIPTSLFNCQELNHLELYGCLVKIPSTFKVFKNLRSLDLQCVKLSLQGLEALISRCPLLQRLVLKNLEGITRVNVRARNLESLDIEGAFQDVTFVVMNHLKTVMVSFSYDIANKPGPSHANSSNLCKFFQHLSKIESLNLANYSLKYLAVGNIPPTLPNALVHLKYLFACMDFNSKEEILTTMCLIRSSPTLKQVDFQNRAEDQGTIRIGTMADYWEDHHACSLEQLQTISMGGISGSEPELELMKFLLASSPNLRKMTIQPVSTSGEGKLLRELLQFRRASAQAEEYEILESYSESGQLACKSSLNTCSKFVDAWMSERQRENKDYRPKCSHKLCSTNTGKCDSARAFNEGIWKIHSWDQWRA